MSRCPNLTPREYKERLDKLGQYIHIRICKYYEKLRSEKMVLEPTRLINSVMFSCTVS